ncbi:MAG TPA: ribosomal protein L7/L12 [Candidatus Krumholzibacteria bacterium]|nr:ribosomal protein L7/L12 [Candidatus Krumholzibacteria bacterium]
MPELDWIEREERYRTRITRALIIISILAVAFFGTGFWLLGRQQKARAKAAVEASTAAAVAAVKHQAEEYTADSTAAATRFTAFKEKYGAQPLEGAPMLMVPLPRGSGFTHFLETTWEEYARVVDPAVEAANIRERFRIYYVDAMNRAWFTPAGSLAWEGDAHPTAILLPDIKQRGKMLEFEKPSFAQIVRGQEAAGVRMVEAVSAGAESLAAPSNDFDVILAAAGAQKEQVLAVIREVTGLGEAEALAIVEGAPKAIKEDVPKAVAEEIKKRLEAVGGSVEIRQ